MASSTYRYLHEHDISPSLFCPICLDVLQDPYIHLNCDSAFCQTCLLKLSKPVCPICRNYWGEFYPWQIHNRYLVKANRLIRNMLDELLVQCQQCQIVRRRGDFEHQCQLTTKETISVHPRSSVWSERISIIGSNSVLIAFFALAIYYRRWIFVETFNRRPTMIIPKAKNLDQYLLDGILCLIRQWIGYVGPMLILTILLWFTLRCFEYRSERANRCLEMAIIVQLITYSIYH